MSLKGRVVLVTGASSGIGWETALAFSERGCLLALAARRVERLRELRRRIEDAGGAALPLACDVARLEDVRAAVAAVLERFGRLDVLVNNAGITAHCRFEEQPLEDIEAMLRTNYLGVVYALKETLPIMRRQGSGHIVNVASVAGLLGVPYLTAYGASKFALVGLTEALRRELYASGITLTSFCPGSVATPMSEEALSDPGLSKLARPKSAREVALRIVRASERREPEVIFGDVPGLLARLTHFFPRTTDRIFHRVYKRLHPLSRATA